MNPLYADKLILLVVSTLLLSYIASIFYKKTKIPDIIWVLVLGIILGPLLDVFDKDLFLAISPLMSTIALSIILFDAGINVDIKMLEKTLIKSTALAVSTFLSVVVTLGLVLSYLMPDSFNLLQAMLLGSMVGGTSTLAVFGILSGLEELIPNLESTNVLLMMESVVSDPICIISSITLIRMIMLPEVLLLDSLVEIVSIFVLSSATGFIMGVVWTEMLHRLKGKRWNYIITIAILLLIYVMVERMIGEGGGTMAALVFGLTISNYNYFARRLGINRSLLIDRRKLREFHEEITFFIKAFFFVYIGLIVTVSVEYAKIGLGVVALVLVVRFLVSTGIASLMKFSREEAVLSRLIFAQGLPAFVMSQLPSIFDPGRIYFINPDVYPNLCMPIVLGTVLIAAIAGPIIAKRQLG